MAQDIDTNPDGAYPLLFEHSIENNRKIKVIVIGAGFSGIYLGIRIPQKLRNVELTIYDKNAGVGGTWFENTYPNVGSDIPSYCYQYSFNPNPNWSAFYAPGKEIQQYLEDTSRRYSVDRFLKLSHEVTSCVYDDASGLWTVKVKDLTSGHEIEDTANCLVIARGNMNTPKWPDIPGLADFAGPKMHSTQWQHDVDFSGKHVAVIGTSASAIQLVPALQKIAKQVDVYARGPRYITNPWLDDQAAKFGTPSEYKISEEDQRKQAEQPEDYKGYIRTLTQTLMSYFPSMFKTWPMGPSFTEMMTGLMQKKLANKPEIAAKLIPDYAFGCTRPTPGLPYLNALNQPNVNFISDPIVAITSTRLRTSTSTNEADILVCATGFQTSNAPPFQVLGSSGRDIQDVYRPYPKSYLGVGMPGFPNYFTVLGPNSYISAGSLTSMIEAQGSYIVTAIRKLQGHNYRSMSPKQIRADEYAEYADRFFARTVFTDHCASFLKDSGDGKRITGLWPGSLLATIHLLRDPRWEDFEFEVETRTGKDGRGEWDNAMAAWLGNGYSEANLSGKPEDLSWFLEEGRIDYPAHPLPERNGGIMHP